MTEQHQQEPSARPVIGVSACLLGHAVRFDGGHKKNSLLTDVLERYWEFRAFCPETAIGLGIPRPPIRLVGDPARPRALGTRDASQDFTSALHDYACDTLPQLDALSGFILKKDSPSCGMERVRVYRADGKGAERKGVGIFAAEIQTRRPLLPVEEEGRLNDPLLKENFVSRVFVYHRWQQMLAEGLSARKLIEFHSRHKYLVMAHSQAAYQRMGRLLSDLSGDQPQRISDHYIEQLMDALKRRVTRARHVNVLQHIMGYLKKNINSDDKEELLASIETYRREETPLVVPISLLRHYFRRFPDNYMDRQYYLRPYPDAIGLRNSI